jgi:hypothetical protein
MRHCNFPCAPNCRKWTQGLDEGIHCWCVAHTGLHTSTPLQVRQGANSWCNTFLIQLCNGLCECNEKLTFGQECTNILHYNWNTFCKYRTRSHTLFWKELGNWLWEKDTRSWPWRRMWHTPPNCQTAWCYNTQHTRTKKTKLHGLNPQANYTDRATATCQQN